jgi:LPS-assembly protein
MRQPGRAPGWCRLALSAFALPAALAAQSAPPPPAPAAAPPPAVSAPAADRIRFELKVPAAKGGGAVVGTAASLETQGEADAVLSGAVEIAYKDLKITAERLVFHRDQMAVEAVGEVVFDQGPNRISAERVELDLELATGTFWNATAYVDPEYHFSGAVVSKTGPDDYEVKEGVFTSCAGDPTPDWSFGLSSAKVTVGGYARVKNATMRVKKLPVFYWPYLLWPAKTERTTGLLIPNVGYSRRRGAYLGLAHYQVLGPSYDNTIYADLYGEQYAGLGDELRYRPSDGTRGQAMAYALYDPVSEDVEWKLRWSHQTTGLPWGLRGVVAFEEFSDFDFFRQFERAESDNTRRFLYSNAFVSGSWGAQSLNVMLDQRETFLGSGATVTQRQLPEIEYRLRQQKLGELPLYLSIASTASFLQNVNEGLYDVGYGRFDLAPELTLPVKIAPWLSLSVAAGGRATYWGESLPESRPDPVTGANGRFCDDRTVAAGEIYCGDALSRVFPTAAVDVVGPSFSKIFDRTAGRFDKFKHVIEPRFSYAYVGDFDEQSRVPRFDEIDGFRSTNVGEMALVNRVLAKPTDAKEGGAFEIFSLELAQLFSFDDLQPLQTSRDGSEQRLAGPISTRLRYNPSRAYSLQAQASYSTLFSGLESTSVSGRADFGPVDLNLTWFTRYNAEIAEKTSDQARLGFGFELWPGRLRLDGQVNYDIEGGEVQQQRYFLSYLSQCFGFSLELREQITASYQSRDYRFSITLKNVGTFLDLTGGDSAASR